MKSETVKVALTKTRVDALPVPAEGRGDRDSLPTTTVAQATVAPADSIVTDYYHYNATSGFARRVGRPAARKLPKWRCSTTGPPDGDG
ncbi:MAG: hypothetical protein NTY65_09330 [Planctomycetota bacterium]|nr:hypothetical protein [Planctomycetota bacterium]